MKLSELLSITGILPALSFPDREISGICCNSADASANSLFVCIRGYVNDGHEFAAECYARGCRCFLAEHPLDLPSDAVVITVENSRRALASVSHAFYGFPSEKMCVIGITGTKGKTSVAHILSSILNENGIRAACIGTTGIEFPGYHAETGNTTPESIELASVLADLVSRGIQVAILEVSSQALYLDRVYGIRFFATAFTNLSPDHIGSSEHPSFAHYLHCKRKLFAEYPARHAVFNAADPYFPAVSDGCLARKITFGTSSSDYHAAEISSVVSHGVPGVRFTLCAGKEKFPCFLPLPGEFNVQNALCAVALAETLGVPPRQSVLSLPNAAVPGRSEPFSAPTGALFIIDYAHNGISVESVLRTLRPLCKRKLWCVIGSVGGRTELRRAAIGRAVSFLCDEVVLTSDNPDFEEPLSICEDIRNAFVRDIPCHIIENRADAIRFAAKNAGKGDIVLLAGKGHEQYQLIRGEKHPFSERAVLEECFE